MSSGGPSSSLEAALVYELEIRGDHDEEFIIQALTGQS